MRTRSLRMFIALLALITATLTIRVGANPGGIGSARFELVEASITDMLKAIQTGLLTSEDSGPDVPRPHRCLRLQRTGAQRVSHGERPRGRRRQGARRGAPKGIERRRSTAFRSPLKDNVDTFDMPTTAGSVALAGSIPPDDAFITQKLRAAGAVILGKATLTEFANFLTNGMPAGYSSLGGYGYNPYDPRPSASPGSATDGRCSRPAGRARAPASRSPPISRLSAIGTETSGSILSPASANRLVGIKPTVGLVSRAGIIPITADQDTAGPLARTVRDAAIVLGVIAGYDPADAATAPASTPGNCFDDYTQFLDAEALAGARIAVPPFGGSQIVSTPSP